MVTGMYSYRDAAHRVLRPVERVPVGEAVQLRQVHGGLLGLRAVAHEVGHRMVTEQLYRI